MDIDILKNIIFALTAMILAFVLVRKYRHFFERKKGEDLTTFIQRTREERRKYKAMQQVMFGSPGATSRANLINLAVVYVLIFCSTRAPTLMFGIFGYLAIGFLVSYRAASAAKAADHNQLSVGDRLWFRLFFACAWPRIFSKKGN